LDTRELERIRFVAGRFGSLQGLRGAVVGGAYVAAFAATVLIGGWPPNEDIVWIALGSAVIVMVVVMLRLDRLYVSRFGRARGTGRMSWGHVLVGALMLAMAADRSLTPPGTPSTFFLTCGVVSVAVAIRDFPYRADHLIDALACVVAAVVFGRLNAAHGFTTAFATGLAILGAAMVVSGLFDHRILSTTLRAGEDVNHADAV
jgi:hypothetical protein